MRQTVVKRRHGALAFTSALLLLMTLGIPGAVAQSGTVSWDGQGATSQDCEAYEQGEIHWIFQAGPGSSVTGVDLYVPSEATEAMELQGQNNWSAYTGFGEGVVEDGVISFPDEQPYVEYTGTLGRNARLLISGFCAQEVGSLTIVKVTDPAGVAGAFDFTIDGPAFASPGSFTLAHGESEYFGNLPLGDYTVTELVPTNWELEDVSCEGGNVTPTEDGVIAHVDADGVHITCTFTDVPFGSILIEKTYTVDPGEGNLAEFAVWTAISGEAEAVKGVYVEDMTRYENYYCADGLPFGDYMVVESVAPQHFEEVGDFFVTVDTPSNCADRLAASEPDVDAVIENTPIPVDAIVTKYKLTFEAGELVPTEVALAGFTFSLYRSDAAEEVPIDTVVTDASGEALFEGLEVGAPYYICEEGTPNPGYWTAGGCEYFTPELGTDVELSFFNAPRADISVGFTDVTGFTSATIACYDADDELIDSIDLSTTGSLDLSELDLGDYHCEIEIRNGAVLPPNGG